MYRDAFTGLDGRRFHRAIRATRNPAKVPFPMPGTLNVQQIQ
jgi:hypothetical protein